MWDGDNRFNDDMDDTVTLEVTDNADGQFIVINTQTDQGEAAGIALNAESANALAELLLTLAAGLD